nr:hypothetical protein [Tanacetum cinerariifolium]
ELGASPGVPEHFDNQNMTSLQTLDLTVHDLDSIALLTITGSLDTALDLNYFLGCLVDDLWASELPIFNLSPTDRQEMSRISETINDYPNRVLLSLRL